MTNPADRSLSSMACWRVVWLLVGFAALGHFNRVGIAVAGSEVFIPKLGITEAIVSGDIDPISYGLVMRELERGSSTVRSLISVQSALVIFPISESREPLLTNGSTKEGSIAAAASNDCSASSDLLIAFNIRPRLFKAL